MLRINRSLSIENDNLSECIHILEKDLEFAISDFEELIEQVRNGGRVTQVKKRLGQSTAKITED
jgi:predicted nucleic acid-binding protein